MKTQTPAQNSRRVSIWHQQTGDRAQYMAGAACPGAGVLRGCPDTQVWPGGADQQPPGETVPGGQQGLQWGTTMCGRKERVSGKGQKGRYDRDTWRNRVNPGQRGASQDGRTEGRSSTCAVPRGWGRGERGAGVQLRRDGARSPSLASSLLPLPCVFYTHIHACMYIHKYLSNTYFSLPAPILFPFAPSLLSSLSFSASSGPLAWPPFVLLGPAFFLLSFPFIFLHNPLLLPYRTQDS